MYNSFCFVVYASVERQQFTNTSEPMSALQGIRFVSKTALDKEKAKKEAVKEARKVVEENHQLRQVKAVERRRANGEVSVSTDLDRSHIVCS